LLDAVSDHVAVLDAQGVIVAVNAAWRQHAQLNSPLNGQITPRSDVGTDYLAVSAPGNPAAVDGIRAVLSGQTDLFNLRYPCHTPDRVCWFNMRVTPLFWDGQRGVVVAHADVTPDHLAKEALRQGELRFRTLFDSLPHVAIQGYGPDGTTRYWNAASEKLYGFSARDALGANLLDLIIPPEMHDGVKQAVADMMRTGEPIATAELNLQRKDGSRVQVLSSHALVHTPDEGDELFCVDVDLSARQQMEDALRESEQRFRNIANATPVMIWMAGLDTLCYWFNAGWLAFTGRTLEQEQGNGWAEGVHPDDLQRCVDYYLDHFGRHEPFQMEYRLMHHSGQYRWIHDSGMPRFDDSGVFLGFIGSCVDSHEVHSAQDRLIALAAVVPGVIFEFVSGPGGLWQFSYISKGVDALFGVSAETAFRDNTALRQRVVPEDLAAYVASIEEAVRNVAPWQHQYRILTLAGELKWVRTHAVPQPRADGSILWSGLITDVTEQKELEQRLRQGANVFDHVQEAILITDAQRLIIDVNTAFTRTTGYSREDALGQNPRLLKSDHQSAAFYQSMWHDIDTQDYWVGEVINRNKSGQLSTVILNISAVKNATGQVTHYVGVATDISHLKVQQELLEHVAHFDALTQLPNRVLLADRLNQAIAQAQRNQAMVAICYLDLDGFKLINDTQGHQAGDMALKIVATRMTEVLRASDTAARMGGDEFVVLMSEIDDISSVKPMLERLLRAIDQPMDIQGQRAHVSASMGVSLYPDNALEPDTLLRQADMAMYQAKIEGKNCYRISSQKAHDNRQV